MLPVVGGSIVPDGEWPDVVAVLGTHGECTGTLVAPDVVLTAGHCAQIEPIEVVARTNDYASGGERVDVASVTPYPGWETSYDVAAIVLAHPITDIAPRTIAVECTFDGFARDTAVRIVGFGRTVAAGDSNTALHEAMTQVIDPDCMFGHGCRELIAPDGEFVAGDDATASCFGDSGGPVYLGEIAIAAVSRGLAGASDACSGAIYVRLDKIADWLEHATGRALARDACPPPASGGCSTSRGGDIGGLLALLALVRLSGGHRTRRPGLGFGAC